MDPGHLYLSDAHLTVNLGVDSPGPAYLIEDPSIRTQTGPRYYVHPDIEKIRKERENAKDENLASAGHYLPQYPPFADPKRGPARVTMKGPSRFSSIEPMTYVSPRHNRWRKGHFSPGPIYLPKNDTIEEKQLKSSSSPSPSPPPHGYSYAFPPQAPRSARFSSPSPSPAAAAPVSPSPRPPSTSFPPAAVRAAAGSSAISLPPSPQPRFAAPSTPSSPRRRQTYSARAATATSTSHSIGRMLWADSGRSQWLAISNSRLTDASGSVLQERRLIRESCSPGPGAYDVCHSDFDLSDQQQQQLKRARSRSRSRRRTKGEGDGERREEGEEEKEEQETVDQQQSADTDARGDAHHHVYDDSGELPPPPLHDTTTTRLTSRTSLD